ncbi:hypothetical protein SDC9_17051 [bioreactor metagenome]|uniref:Uncharacterized protein n=1 Tax=bioreactor metagenome TaxID=1076179 RepID=A0A644TXV3_9ZZZZ
MVQIKKLLKYMNKYYNFENNMNIIDIYEYFQLF